MKAAIFIIIFLFVNRDSVKKAEMDDCFSERFTEKIDDELYRHLEIHLSDGNFQRELKSNQFLIHA